MIDNMGNEEKQSLTQEPIQLAPTVIDSLSRSENMNDIMLSFFRLVAEQKFPLDNISFLKKWRSIATEPHGMKIKQGLLEKYGSCGLTWIWYERDPEWQKGKITKAIERNR